MTFLRRAPFIRRISLGNGIFIINSGSGTNQITGKAPVTYWYSGWNSQPAPLNSASTPSLSNTAIGSISSIPIFNGNSVVAIEGQSWSGSAGGVGLANVYLVVVSGNNQPFTPNALDIDGTQFTVHSTSGVISVSGNEYSVYSFFPGSQASTLLNSSADNVKIT
jgi:hypothetical protein